ncbi:B3/4 domain-containing protein [Cupriavidus sp. amp6]|uniref:B3/B4 domain-containing protein n=1 Tax=Cupriavidus sp. amp6 TaxID=388051 RepID=UPI000688888E|nr:phenylalanine--tRNA ligase beta subunit-related protein [Cupriavidus sp. amp6]
MEYLVSDDIFCDHPHYCRGVILVQVRDNRSASPELVALLRAAEHGTHASITGNVAEHPRISAWRDAFRLFGARASEYRSSIESLVRRVAKADALPSINPLVDIGTIASLRHLLPVGVHPVPASAALQLRRARPGDRFAPPDGGAPEPIAEGEIILAASADVLTRRWTWRQAANTQTLPDTSMVFVNIDGLPPATRAEVQAAMQDVQHLIEAHGIGVAVQSAVLSRELPSALLHVG